MRPGTRIREGWYILAMPIPYSRIGFGRGLLAAAVIFANPLRRGRRQQTRSPDYRTVPPPQRSVPAWNRNHDPGLPTPDADLPTLKQLIAGLRAAFPDLTSTEEELIAQGNRVVVHRMMRGSHQAAFMGVLPIGKNVEFGSVWMAHLSGGKIREQWVYFDALGMLQQIDAIPSAG